MFEYKIESPADSGGNVFSMEAYLNLMGTRGWELVSFNPQDGTLIFKRQIAINEKIRAYQLKEDNFVQDL